jgi:hypothetical protein
MNTLLALIIVAGSILPAPPSATLEWTIDGVDGAVVMNGAPMPNGNYAYFHTVNTGTAKVTFNYAADVTPDGNAAINGATTVENLTGDTIAVATSFETGLCPGVSEPAIGGLATAKLVCNAGGGIMGCGTEPHVGAAVSNAQPTVGLWFCPFSLWKTGAGSATIATSFGTPLPSLAWPEPIDTLGHAMNFTLSSGDKVIATCLYVVAGTVADPPGGPCDIDGSGTVTKDDLTAIVAALGSFGCAMPEDVNGDGMVDATDIDAWNVCVDSQ